jgi:hypothetical protein
MATQILRNPFLRRGELAGLFSSRFSLKSGLWTTYGFFELQLTKQIYGQGDGAL